jgi:hypothetical protein
LVLAGQETQLLGGRAQTDQAQYLALLPQLAAAVAALMEMTVQAEAQAAAALTKTNLAVTERLGRATTAALADLPVFPAAGAAAQVLRELAALLTVMVAMVCSRLSLEPQRITQVGVVEHAEH